MDTTVTRHVACTVIIRAHVIQLMAFVPTVVKMVTRAASVLRVSDWSLTLAQPSRIQHAVAPLGPK